MSVCAVKERKQVRHRIEKQGIVLPRKPRIIKPKSVIIAPSSEIELGRINSYAGINYSPQARGAIIASRRRGSTGGGGGGGGGGTLSFVGQTNWARPSPGSPAEAQALGWTLVPFTTASGFYTALNNLTGHQYIYYNGTGVLNISASTNQYGGLASVISLSGKNPSSTTVIDLGCSHNIWDISKITSNYVHIEYTGSTAGWFTLGLWNCSNIHLFGGDISSGGAAAAIYAPTHDLYWWDGYINNTGAGAIGMSCNTTGGAVSTLYNTNLRLEISRWGMKPSLDDHADKGSGQQGVNIHGSGAGGTFHDIALAIYGHNPLQPGETSYGTVWPQGSGGSVIEAGSAYDTNYNYTMYVLAENMHFIPAYSGGPLNPGSSPFGATGGNGFNLWGKFPLNTTVIPWAEGNDLSGAVIHGAGGSWYNSTPLITVQHGRHNNVNQFSGHGTDNITVPYDNRYNLVYQDCL